MDKLEFCSKLIHDLDSLITFIEKSHNLFYDISVPDKYPYYPPKDSQSLLIGHIDIILLSAKYQVEQLQEFLSYPDNRII